MKTLVLVIKELPDGGDAYPVELYVENGVDWRNTPTATGAIPLVETRPPFPKDANGEPLSPNGVLTFVLNQNSPSARTFDAIGEYLWGLLDRGDIHREWTRAWAEHAKVQRTDVKEGLRTILDIRPQELRMLPWEFAIRDRVPFFAMPYNPVLRGPLVPSRTPPVDGWSLRVLVLIGSTPGDAAVNAEAEIEQLGDAFHGFRRAIHARVERPASADALLRVYNEFAPHVLHFTGHARQVKIGGGRTQSILEFHDPAGNPWQWEAGRIREHLVNGPPRLAFLNACRTGVEGAHDAVGTIAGEFLAAGTLAVVAMHADIAGTAAATVAGAVYVALAAGRPIDVALAEARYAVRNQPDLWGMRDWALPSLTAVVPPTDVLPPRFPFTEERRREIEGTPEFAELRAFVDRREQRIQVDALAAKAASIDLLIVRGDSEAGKTAMVHWCMEGCAWHEHKLKYVDLKRPEKPDFVDVLHWIIDEDPGISSPLRQALQGDFRQFREYAQLVATGAHPPAGAPDDPVREMFAAFRAALVQTARDQPLILAIDHLGRLDPADFKKYLRPHLIDVIAGGRLRPVRLVLGCTDEDYRALDLRQLEPVAEVVKVHDFPTDEFQPLLAEFLRCHKVDRAVLKQLVLPAPAIPWKPEALLRFQKVLEVIGVLGR